MSAAAVTLGVRMDRISLSIPPDPAFRGTLRLVVGGIGARSPLSYEQVSELQLAAESLVANRRPAGAAVVVEAQVDGSQVSLLVGPFSTEDDPARMRVLRGLVQRVEVIDRDGAQWLELTAEAAR